MLQWCFMRRRRKGVHPITRRVVRSNRDASTLCNLILLPGLRMRLQHCRPPPSLSAIPFPIHRAHCRESLCDFRSQFSLCVYAWMQTLEKMRHVKERFLAIGVNSIHLWSRLFHDRTTLIDLSIQHIYLSLLLSFWNICFVIWFREIYMDRNGRSTIRVHELTTVSRANQLTVRIG